MEMNKNARNRNKNSNLKQGGNLTLRLALGVSNLAALLLIAACGGSKDTNSTAAYLPPGCVPNQPCTYNALSAGSAVVLQGQISNVNSDVAKNLALVQNGNFYSAGIRYGLANLTITAQGNPTGGTAYNINLTIQPVQTNILGFCGTLQSSCTNPIIVTGNAAYYPMSDGTQWLILQYGGMKLEVIAPSTYSSSNAFNGSQTLLNDVQVKVVRPGRDFLQGELLGTAFMNTYQTGAVNYGGFGGYGPSGYGSPAPYYNPYGWGW